MLSAPPAVLRAPAAGAAVTTAKRSTGKRFSPLFPSAFASLNSEPSGGSVEPSPNSKRPPLALGRGTSPPKACRIPRQLRPFPPFPDCSRPVSPTGLTEATREWSRLQPRGSGHPRRSTRDPSPKHNWKHPASLPPVGGAAGRESRSSQPPRKLGRADQRGIVGLSSPGLPPPQDDLKLISCARCAQNSRAEGGVCSNSPCY